MVGMLQQQVATPPTQQQGEPPVLVGNPLRARYPDGELAYARNIWVMQPFDGRLFLGHGSARNDPPAVNAGPVALWAYDPQQGAFVSEFIADDEAIMSFLVAGDVLYAPGHDAREDWTLGNIYRRPAGGAWEKLRTVPHGVHVEDLLMVDGGLFAAIAIAEIGQAPILRSYDGGRTWPDSWVPPSSDPRLPALEGPSRVHALWQATGTVWASAFPSIFLDAETMEPVVMGNIVYRLEGDSFMAVDENLFPQSEALYHQVTHVVPGAHHVVLLVTPYSGVEDAEPARLFAQDVATGAARALPLPAGAEAFDAMAHGDGVWVLVGTPQDDGRWQVGVWATCDPDRHQWGLLAQFEAPTFARSFALFEGDVWFGLGTDTVQLSPHAGDVLRLPGNAVPVCPQ